MHNKLSLKPGDFSSLASQYIHRTGYSLSLLKALSRYAQLDLGKAVTADVGAGTGKLTENLIELGFKGFAIEPNEAMRAEGVRLCGNNPFLWSKGTAEKTLLPDSNIDWVLMGSSFHWTDSKKALEEFHRILKPGGFFVALWNPRNLEVCPFQMEIENWIYEQVPNLKRVSSGSNLHIKDLSDKLLEGSYFKEPILMETSYVIEMTKERYLGAWNSVNDIRSQTGEVKFLEIIDGIAEKIADKNSILVPYKTRAWIVQAVEN